MIYFLSRKNVMLTGAPEALVKDMKKEII